MLLPDSLRSEAVAFLVRGVELVGLNGTNPHTEILGDGIKWYVEEYELFSLYIVEMRISVGGGLYFVHVWETGRSHEGIYAFSLVEPLSIVGHTFVPDDYWRGNGNNGGVVHDLLCTYGVWH